MRRFGKPGQSGFTLVEVMIAIGIMTVGSLGILSMHQAVSGANRTAQGMNTAIAITERWVERIERDSLSWSEQGLNTSSLNGTAYLSSLAGSPHRPTGSGHSRRIAMNHTDSITLAMTPAPLVRSNTARICA